MMLVVDYVKNLLVVKLITDKDFRCYSLVEVKELFSLTHSNMFLVYMVF